MTITARSMVAGRVKYLGWSHSSQHPEYLTTRLPRNWVGDPTPSLWETSYNKPMSQQPEMNMMFTTRSPGEIVNQETGLEAQNSTTRRNSTIKNWGWSFRAQQPKDFTTWCQGWSPRPNSSGLRLRRIQGPTSLLPDSFLQEQHCLHRKNVAKKLQQGPGQIRQGVQEDSQGT